MTRIGFIAPPFAGHVRPMQALAEALIARGHEAVFFQQVDAAGLLEAGTARFVAVGGQSHPPGQLAGVIGRLNALRGVWGLGQVMGDLVRSTTMLCATLPQAMGAHGIEMIVADQTEAAGALVARHLRLPYVSVANALPINTDAAVPPPFTTWGYDPTGWGLGRNRGGYRVARAMMRPLNRVVAQTAAEWGLGALSSMEDCLSPTAQLSQLVAGLDFPRLAPPPGFTYVGPLRRGEVQDWTAPAQPFVYASLGTLQGDRPGLFQVIAQACMLAGVRCVIAHGGRLSARDQAALPGAPTVCDWVPQAAVLRQAAAVISHGGMNTVLDALAWGVPIIAIPLALEQAATAARVVHAGAGLRLRARRLGAAELARALRRVLTQPGFRVAAGRLKDEIARSGGVALAADIIEEHASAPI